MFASTHGRGVGFDRAEDQMSRISTFITARFTRSRTHRSTCPANQRDGADRALGLRKVDVHSRAQSNARPHARSARRRTRLARRSGHLRARHRSGDDSLPDRHGLPAAQPVSEVHLRQRRLRPAHSRRAQSRHADGRSASAACATPRSGTRSRIVSTVPLSRSRADSSSGSASRAVSRSIRR